MATRQLVISLAFALASSQIFAADNNLEGLKSRIVGNWQSISCELRPQQNQQDPHGAPSSVYLQRDFTYYEGDTFAANITVFVDPACAIPAASYDLAGDILWHGPNPAVAGAWSQDYVLNKQLELTVLAQPLADQLNALPKGACGEGKFEVGEVRDILGQPCALLKFVDGNRYVIDHDLLYVRDDTPNMLFMGAKHVDGTGFYYPQNRPFVGLQQPLIKTQ